MRRRRRAPARAASVVQRRCRLVASTCRVVVCRREIRPSTACAGAARARDGRGARRRNLGSPRGRVRAIHANDLVAQILHPDSFHPELVRRAAGKERLHVLQCRRAALQMPVHLWHERFKKGPLVGRPCRGHCAPERTCKRAGRGHAARLFAQTKMHVGGAAVDGGVTNLLTTSCVPLLAFCPRPAVSLTVGDLARIGAH